jgi:type I restriction enzyme S subunit
MNPQSYPAYRESGIEVIDDLPFNWGTSKVAHIAKNGYKTFIDGDWIESPYITDWGVRLIQTGNVGVGAYKEQGFRYVTEETFRALRCTEVSPNDVLICRLADPVGRACLAPNLGVKMITSVDVCILKVSDDWDQRYVTYFLSSKPYLDLMGAVSRGGTRDRISRSFLGNVRIAKPNLSEQAAIADFLDRETAEADALIAKYERLIELLEEKRIAVITQAVTKGLDPSVPMKHSGVEWIGEIPAHWQFQRISRIFGMIGSGTTPPATESEWYGGDTPFVTTAELRENIIKQSARSVTDRALQQYSSLRIYSAGTILLAMYGATIGRSAILGIPAAVNQACCALGHSKVLSADFAFKWLQAYRAEIVALGVGGGQPNISQDLVKSIYMPIPPIDEQRAINERVDGQIRHIEDLKWKTAVAIRLVKERRSALVTAAVTGQIDVSTYKSNPQAEAVA